MNWSAVSCLAALMLNLLPQQEKLAVAVMSEEPGPEAEFTAQQVEDAVTVILTAKMPDVVIQHQAFLVLYIAPVCISLGDASGYACAWDIALLGDRDWAEEPVAGNIGKRVLWRRAGVIAGPPGNSLAQLRKVLEGSLDAPIASWRRLAEEQRSCWTAFFDGSSAWLTSDWGEYAGSVWNVLIAGREELTAHDSLVAISARDTALIVARNLWTYGPCWASR